MVDTQTQQFLYRAVISTVCGLTSLILIFICVMAFHLGDGEAVSITNAMTPLFISLIGGMTTLVLGVHAAGAYGAKQMAAVHIAQITAQPTAAAAATVSEGSAAA